MMMRLVQVTVLVAGAMAAMDSDGKTGLDVLAKRRLQEKLPTGIGFLAFMRRLSNSTNTSNTTTTTMAATTTTTMAATTTTTMGATTTSTTTTGATTTSTTGATTTTGPTTTSTTGPTTTTTTTFGGAKFDAKVTLAVADTSWVSNSNAHNIMKDAINASNPDVTNPNMVTINSLVVVTRRLQEKQPTGIGFFALMRRLAAGSIECAYTITFPPTYTGNGYIPAAVDSNAMVAKIENNDYNVTVNVTSVSVAVSACSGGRCSTTTTTTTTVATTTTAASVVDTTTTTAASGSGGGDSGGGNTDPKDTTTTTVAPVVVVTTTTVGATVAFNAKFSVEVTDAAAFLGDLVKAKKVMADAIAAGNDEVTDAEMVVVNSIKKLEAGGRRLGERRLAGDTLEVDYTVNFPSGYKGAGITSANTDWSKMTESINKNKHGVDAKVAAGGFKWTKAPTCSGGGCPATTTGPMTTTGEVETGGAVSAKQLATSVAAVLLVKLLSGM